jgi:signal transduction histidine kinase
MRYSKNGYFFIYDYNGVNLMHPIKPQLVGKNLYNLKDKNGVLLIQKLIQSAKNGGEYVYYIWEHPKTKKPENKIGYALGIDDWKWMIGTGLYINDIKSVIQKKRAVQEKRLKNALTNIFLIVIVAILIVSFLSYLFLNRIKNIILSYNEKIKNHNKTLEKQVEEKTKQNIKQLELIQQQSKLASMGEMIGAIAHQWRQPLNTIATSIQNLKYDYKEGKLNNEDFIDNFIQKNKKTIKFMSKTIDDFRSFFRVDKEKVDFKVKEATQAVIDMQSAQLKDHHIKVNISGEEFLINGFLNEYQQVILNIINNAKDALIDAHIENPIINITLKNKKILIQDNAGGIPNNIIDRIFEPYFTTKEQGKGTGIGLYMSKMIIENNMGGTLSVKNGNGGALFVIEFDNQKEKV